MNRILSGCSFSSLLIASAASVFLGRAYQHLFHDAPFRALLWDETIMSSIVRRALVVQWDTYLRDPVYDQYIVKMIIGFGIFYLICFGWTLIVGIKKHASAILLFGALLLVFLAGLYCKEKFYSPAQFFEYTLQFSSPVFLYCYLRKLKQESLIMLMKVGIALTFISHGLYALGVYPVPGYFVQMTMDILPFTEAHAHTYLKLAGVMDIVISVLIFTRGKWAKLALWYAFVWGGLTALARIVAHFEMDTPLMSLHLWGYATVYRAPHFLIPLAVLVSKDFRDR